MGSGASREFPLKSQFNGLREWSSDELEDLVGEINGSDNMFAVQIGSLGKAFGTQVLADGVLRAIHANNATAHRRNGGGDLPPPQGAPLVSSMALLAGITVLVAANEDQTVVELARSVFDVFDLDERNGGLTFDMATQLVLCTLNAIGALTAHEGDANLSQVLNISPAGARNIAQQMFECFHCEAIELVGVPAPETMSISYSEFSSWTSAMMMKRNVNELYSDGEPITTLDFNDVMTTLGDIAFRGAQGPMDAAAAASDNEGAHAVEEPQKE